MTFFPGHSSLQAKLVTRPARSGESLAFRMPWWTQVFQIHRVHSSACVNPPRGPKTFPEREPAAPLVGLSLLTCYYARHLRDLGSELQLVEAHALLQEAKKAGSFLGHYKVTNISQAFFFQLVIVDRSVARVESRL